MPAALKLSLIREFSLAYQGPGEVLLRGTGLKKTLQGPPGVIAALLSLPGGQMSEGELADLVIDRDGPEALPRFYTLLKSLTSHGLIRYHALQCDRELARLEPFSPHFSYRVPAFAPQEQILLSRFALLRREGAGLMLESPLALARVFLPDPLAASFVAALALPRSPRELKDVVPGLSEECALLLLNFVYHAGALTTMVPGGHTAEEQDERLGLWAFHDLLLHARSRAGRSPGRTGGNYPGLDRFTPLPALKPPATTETIPLNRPELENLLVEDLTFTKVLEERRSARAFGDTPLTLQQLGEFLYRSARCRQVYDYEIESSETGSQHTYPVSNRPYPSAGAIYDLELYLTVSSCPGLAPGLYHYDPSGHSLEKMRDEDYLTRYLLAQAASAVGMSERPPLLITLTSRFQRMSWKYEGLAYASTLKNVGALYQTFYLVARAMNLGACALGSGNADAFAEAIGSDYLAESSVGEFLIGPLP